ncbi:MAG TPA: DUF1800 domain-containing protein [Phycisphaerales bacterium]|nr:DUF1800 domain-containing protein [Phycisphaerales bacterium]HMP37292.1 DUF1800 domain-containing protein [Phycisphaerales bacterium]
MPIDSLRQLDPAKFDETRARHLLSRAGFGGTPEQVAALTRIGLLRAVDHLVDYDRLPEPDDAESAARFSPDIIRPPTEAEAAEARRARRENDEPALERLQRERNRRQAMDREQLAAMRRWWLRRMIESPRPLEEKMTLFWHGHFATGHRTIEDSWHMLLQNRLFRRRATGNFGALASEIIRDPAMLRYLDNNRNRRRSPNENLARELMELFVLGEGTGYTERDIKEAARALTGYTFVDDQFVFRGGDHDDGPKTIFGRSGNFDGDGLLRLLFERPAASEFICWKLYRFFVDDGPAVSARTPPRAVQGFIRRLAALLRESRFELRPVLRTLFLSEHFHHPSVMAATIKSPVQLVVQTVRSLGTPVRNLSTLLEACAMMGQELFQPPNVKGWDGGRAWINTATVFVRQNVAVFMLTGAQPGGGRGRGPARQGSLDRYDARPLVDHLRDPAGALPPPRAVAEAIARVTLACEPAPDRIDAVESVLAPRLAPGSPDEENRGLVAALVLITALPEYQLC